MIYALLAVGIIQTLLLMVIALYVVETHTDTKWLRDTLIPFMASLSRFINPGKQ
jgi:Na+-transporting NADH:ubiquinone oxidoreductase subunit NqrB